MWRPHLGIIIFIERYLIISKLHSPHFIMSEQVWKVQYLHDDGRSKEQRERMLCLNDEALNLFTDEKTFRSILYSDIDAIIAGNESKRSKTTGKSGKSKKSKSQKPLFSIITSNSKQSDFTAQNMEQREQILISLMDKICPSFCEPLQAMKTRLLQLKPDETLHLRFGRESLTSENSEISDESKADDAVSEGEIRENEMAEDDSFLAKTRKEWLDAVKKARKASAFAKQKEKEWRDVQEKHREAFDHLRKRYMTPPAVHKRENREARRNLSVSNKDLDGRYWSMFGV